MVLPTPPLGETTAIVTQRCKRGARIISSSRCRSSVRRQASRMRASAESRAGSANVSGSGTPAIARGTAVVDGTRRVSARSASRTRRMVASLAGRVRAVRSLIARPVLRAARPPRALTGWLGCDESAISCSGAEHGGAPEPDESGPSSR